MTNYYVYYRVEEARLERVGPAVRKIFGTIESATGVRGRWMRRRDDPATYMEVYEGVQDEQAFEAVLAREGTLLGLERKVERFVCA